MISIEQAIEQGCKNTYEIQDTLRPLWKQYFTLQQFLFFHEDKVLNAYLDEKNLPGERLGTRLVDPTERRNLLISRGYLQGATNDQH